MPNITSDQLRDISVKTVEDFLNNKIPLSAGLAKQAAAAELNPEQIKRAVEASNTICYLKVLGMSQDRTVEFPLCKFAEVMSLVSVPEGLTEGKTGEGNVGNNNVGGEVGAEAAVEKQAGVSDNASSPLELQSPGGAFIVDDYDLLRQKHSKVAFFIKEASINEQALEELKGKSDVVAEQLIKQAQLVSKDVKGLDKLSFVSEGSDYAQLSVLVTGNVQQRRDFGDTCLFKQAELVEVKKLAELFKEARHIVAGISKREDLYKRSVSLRNDMTKQAFLAGAFGVAGKAVGGAFGGVLNTVAKPVTNLVGRSVHNTLGPTFNAARNVVGQGLSKVTGKPFTPSTFSAIKGVGAGAIAGGVLSAGFDAAMHDPGKDASTGRSNDVWDALQRE